jgi:hypothetical protein
MECGVNESGKSDKPALILMNVSFFSFGDDSKHDLCCV